MNNFIFKSASRLIKNSPITLESLYGQLDLVLKEQRHQRSDLHELSLKIQRLMIDKHLQTQVDEYFEKDPFGSAFKESLNEDPPVE